MLKQLIIQNFALAENVDVSFSRGLNVITGETGAGKSLLVDALCLLRGGKIDFGFIRTDQESAHITGLFFVADPTAKVFTLLEENGIAKFFDNEKEVMIKRSIYKNGRQRISVNESVISTKLLQTISAELIDVSSQFENQRLLDSENHTCFLDEFSHSAKIFRDFSFFYEKALGKLKKIKELLKERDLLKREKALYEFELSQIQEANISSTEFAEIESIISLGNKANHAKSILSEIGKNLTEGESNCLSLLLHCKKLFEKLNKQLGESSKVLNLTTEQFNEIIILTEDIQDRLAQTGRQFEIDETALRLAEQRIEIYNRLLSKFGPNLSDVEQYAERCATFLNRTHSLDTDISDSLETCQEAMEKAIELAGCLTEMRQAQQGTLSEAVQNELAELGMPNAIFTCQLIPHSSPLTWHDLTEALTLVGEDSQSPQLVTKFMQLSKFGSEKAQFLLSANTGIAPQFIEKVASGGELSRIMLALKKILFEEDAMSVFVFDEIDTGMSGAIASKVGKKLCDFCQNTDSRKARQAICITHLPQVACYAHHHYIVAKSLNEGKTTTKIKQADQEDRLKEIAFLISGEEVSQEGLAQAQVLLAQAQRDLKILSD